MPDVKSSSLRIYCICGQKMRVSEKMYGLPGKCVACRQKIRIPKKEEIPDGTTEIYLRDHPELLREPPRVPTDEEREGAEALARAGAPATTDEESTPNTELDLVEGPSPPEAGAAPKKRRVGGSIPLDTLPMLQVLTSLQHKFARQIETLDLAGHEDEVLLAELEGHLARVQKLRRGLDDHLHQLLMEVAIELANTQEKLAQTKLAGRTAEISWAEYQESMHRLRARRDRLERRQQNLRGWLATNNPYRAGGLLDLSVESIPEEGFAVTLPPEPEDEASLLAAHTSGLRDALDRRMRTRQRYEEVKRMEAGKEDRDHDELRKALQEERQIARARVAFYTDRLERLQKDYASDLETATAQLNAARDRMKVDEITRQEYDALERDILRGKKDLARAQSVISRALSANTAGDVPHPHGTFLQRLGFVAEPKATPDKLVAWAAAALLVIGIFIPAVSTLSLVGARFEFAEISGSLAWLFAFPVAFAALTAAIAFVPARALRGALQIAAWSAAFLLAVYFLHAARYSLDPMAARFRSGTPWFLQPGIVVLFLGIFGMLASGLMVLWPSKAARPWAIACLAVVAVIAALIGTDVAGVLRPRPVIDVIVSDSQPGSGTIRIRNEGGRALHLLRRPTDAAGSYNFFIDYQVGVSSFSEAKGEGPLWDQSVPLSGVLYTVPAGATQDVPFALGPGEYRVVLESGAQKTPVIRSFIIPAPQIETPPTPQQQQPAPALPAPQQPQPPPAQLAPQEPVEPLADTGQPSPTPPAPAPAEEPSAAEGESQPAPPGPAAQSGAAPEVELQGIMTSADEPPRFTFMLYMPNGIEQRVVLPLGKPLWNGWMVEEYNSDERTVTLQREGRYLILRRKTRTPLALP